MSASLSTTPAPRETVLEVRDLKKHFPIHKGFLGRQVGAVKAVDGVTFSVYPRETLGVVGESGCGKTTVGRTLLRLIEPTSGSALFQGREIFDLGRKELRSLRREMQIIFQDPYSSLNPRMTVGNIIGDALDLHGIARGDERFDRAKDLLERVGLQASYINRYPHEFSGGQRQRIGIARAVALQPKFIVCDEAVSALDVSVQAQVLNLLSDLQEEYELSYLFIAHDLSVVRHIADRIAVMYLGRIVELSPAEDLFEAPLHPYTQALLSAIPHTQPNRTRKRVLLQGDVPSPISPPTGCHFHTRCPLAIERCRVEEPQLVQLRSGHWSSCHQYDGVQHPAEPILIDSGIPALSKAPVAEASNEEPTADQEPEGSHGEDTLDAADFEEATDERKAPIVDDFSMFNGSDDADSWPLEIPRILEHDSSIRMGPFGELYEEADEASTAADTDVPTLSSLTGRYPLGDAAESDYVISLSSEDDLPVATSQDDTDPNGTDQESQSSSKRPPEDTLDMPTLDEEIDAELESDPEPRSTPLGIPSSFLPPVDPFEGDGDEESGDDSKDDSE